MKCSLEICQEEIFRVLCDEPAPLGDGHEKLVIAIEHSKLEHQIRFTGRGKAG